jgi:hypothetical protein
MLNKLPDELLINILQKVNSPLGEFIQLKNVNRAFNKLVLTVPKKHTVSTSELSNICNKNYSVSTFDFIFRNDISFDMSHILILIKNNRLDVLKRGIFYQKFLSQMMNPFYLGKCNQKSDVFDMATIHNPCIVAAMKGKTSILSFLIDYAGVAGNPYRKVIPDVFTIGVRYAQKDVISYLLLNHYRSIKDLFRDKANLIMNRVPNSEDMFMYGFMSGKVYPSNKLLMTAVAMKYNTFFIKGYESLPYRSNISTYLRQSIVKENLSIIDYFITGYKMPNPPLVLDENVFKNKITDTFLKSIVEKYTTYISPQSILIHEFLKRNFDEKLILNLINFNFTFDYSDIELAVKCKYVTVVRDLSNKYLAKNI